MVACLVALSALDRFYIGSRTRSEDQFLCAKVQFILVPLPPPPLSARAPSLRLLWQRHWVKQLCLGRSIRLL